MHSYHWIIGGDGEPKAVTPKVFREWRDNDSPGKVVAKTYWLCGDSVSTCFVGEVGMGNFETMLRVIPISDDDEFMFYDTRDRAMYGHGIAVARATHALGEKPMYTHFRRLSHAEMENKYGKDFQGLLPS